MVATGHGRWQDQADPGGNRACVPLQIFDLLRAAESTLTGRSIMRPGVADSARSDSHESGSPN